MKYIVSFVLAILCFPVGQLAHKYIVGPYYVGKFEEAANKIEAANIVKVQVKFSQYHLMCVINKL